ncbi:protein of unassigned function (plasmid) [Acetobacter orientalis]|uniref:Protein of unassigned function n=1 Tax=Acetobacter orientalis TaxID=146474 RepID=A0A2Z5ZMQ2_9PROT|nr:protein of unassigned function [Acetobacter orientalis]
MTTFKAFVPFGPDAQVQTIDQMTVENDPKRVSVYGRLDITHDQAGLDKARALSALLDAIVARLEAATALPEHTSSSPNTHPMNNPFA